MIVSPGPSLSSMSSREFQLVPVVLVNRQGTNECLTDNGRFRKADYFDGIRDRMKAAKQA